MRQDQLERDYYFLKQMIYYCEQTFARIEFAKKSRLSINDEMVIDSLAMNLGQIGEQLDSSKLSEELREQYSDIPWRKIKDFRNLAYHNYGAIRIQVLLRIIENELPILLDQLSSVLRDIERRLTDS
ncbi:HepT-like ribonuclease domain-containing protein [Streptococcus porcinus]|nr:HepT-like ribonuclease domain-containing protein [Streptococcus porcinus]